MSWQQIKINTTPDHSDSLEQLLLDFGAVSISLLDGEDQPVFQLEPGGTILWEATVIVALFEQNLNLDSCLNTLSTNPGIANQQDIKIEIIEDKDWERAWMDDFKAMQFGDSLWICPSWQTPPQPDAVNIMLDPGLAFGSGTHGTTSLCLQWLEQANLTEKTVIDYGCGSGVLAIAAVLLGAKQVYGVDNDPQAISATLDNSARNKLDSSVISACLPENFPAMEVDIVLANILCAPLIQLAETLANHVKTDGLIVLSGILEEQADLITERYSQWFELDPPTNEAGWLRIDGKRKAV